VKAGVLGVVVAVAVAVSCIGRPAHAEAEAASTVAAFVDAIAATQDPRVASALALIDGTGRRLLALRSYARARAHLAARWSWTAEQIAEYQNSPEHQELQAEVDRVRQSFAQANPGFELWVNPQVRSLDIQIEHWNTNDSVSEAAANLLAATEELIATTSFRNLQSDEARRQVEAYLTRFVPAPTPTIAAPGLSPHGQMRAIDFQVHKAGQVVAGPSTSTIAADWDAAGWTARLEEAVRSGSHRFVGPLATPREPWHYTYTPEAVAEQPVPPAAGSVN
jgi:hypothetical protein